MKILNWQCGEERKIIITRHPLLYIHGSFNDDESENIPEFISLGARKWPVVDGEYKCYTFLKRGSNDVKIEWDADCSYSVNVEYEREPKKREFVQPVYIICKNSDGSFLAPEGVENTMDLAIQRLQFNIRLMQIFFEESLYENGFEKKSFEVVEDEEGDPSFVVLISDLDIDGTLDMSPDQLYLYFHEEISTKFGQPPSCKYLCYMSCTRYYPPANEEVFTVQKIMSYAKGHAALGGGRMALFGTGSLHTWATSLDDLVKCFEDDRMIDRKKLFDDSCGRGTYWANYSTTLGATVHELGHCFDLAHTRHGIMARGHDDMNYFYTVVKGHLCKDSKEVPSTLIKCIDDTGKYKGAHWYRSSATLLNCHKWFNDAQGELDTETSPKICFHPNLLGTFGSPKSNSSNFKSFDSQKWLSENNLDRIVGLVFHYNDFLESIQFHGVKFQKEKEEEKVCHGEILHSDVYGKISESSKQVIFPVSENEFIESIQIRCGVWIDAIQITTNLKSTPWMGGKGGNFYKLALPRDKKIVSWIGTSHEYVGCLAWVLKSTCSDESKLAIQPILQMSNSQQLSLIEIYDPSNGEVAWYQEFDNESGINKELDLLEAWKELGWEEINGTVWDVNGNCGRFSFTKSLFQNYLEGIL